MNRLKTLFTHSDRNKGSLSAASPSHPEIRLGPAQLLDKRRSLGQGSNTHRPQDQQSHAQPSGAYNSASRHHAGRRSSTQRPVSGAGELSVGATDRASQSPGVSEQEDTFANDYRAYTSGVSLSSEASSDADFFGLGNDGRLRTDHSGMRHSEDVADTDHHGSKPLQQNLSESQNADRKVVQDREAIMKGLEDHGLRTALEEVVDLRDTEDADKETRWAPAVTHEVVKPHEHEIIEERIYREIHNHEVHHYIQPVYETEILPARHWVYNAKNELVEVSADELPECTGAKQRWSIVRGDREKPSPHIIRSAPQAREPKIISDKTYITPEGFERRETTILHPPELEDLSNYSGPVVPIEFLHHPKHAPKREIRADKKLDQFPDDRKFTMEELSNALPVTRSSSSSSRPPTGSSASSPTSKRLSIPRKPVPAVPFP